MSHNAQRKRGVDLRPVRRIGRPIEERFWSFVSKSDSCWIWTGGRDQKGYGGFIGMKAHRFSWQMLRGQIPDGLQVCHHCDNPPCVRPDHLFVGTAKENTADMIAKGRFIPSCLGKRGMDVPNAKMTDDDVREARRMIAAGISLTKIARRFGVSKTPIQDIAHGRRWSHVA